ncbi:disintegrin and metalloproteinase domain-containing protein 21-like [Sorex araneus]|uniref:disintegrin and metalloproteinase domain-containing protein 21-like n=1 Tax=Sorex araneus TaxID=42254 RepID=UPI0024336798|nr:disintegrin and metalloproteinase domain-containing protein 21-like [Sorex araneus]
MQLLLLWLKVFLFLGGWSPPVQSQSQGPSEETIPLMITDSDRDTKPSEWISYSLKFEGQRHIVRIKAIKHLLARHMPVFTYTDQGALREDYPFIQDNCYYYGYMDGDPTSQVSLNNCFGGLYGFLHKDNTVYKVEPKLNSTTFQHVVSKLVRKEKDFPARRYGITVEESKYQSKSTGDNHLSTSRQSGIEGWWTHTRYLQLALICSFATYSEYRGNVTVVQDSLMLLLSSVHTNYLQLDLHVTLVELEIWTDRNRASYRHGFSIVETFCKWKETSFSLHVPHDIAILIGRLGRQDTLYMTYPGHVCAETDRCAFINHNTFDDITVSVMKATQALGKQLGMVEDGDNCVCGEQICLMNLNASVAHRFSNCSYADYYAANTKCLLRVPKDFREERCGNGVLEKGEACDCGTIDSCAADPCCETDCTLAPGADCVGGLCCQNCTFLPSGTLCRKEENECDFPEWCNGKSSQCPDDVYVQSGISCEGGGYCHEKMCNKREDQCKRLFGEKAKRAGVECHSDVNARGDRFGNCGFNFTSYTTCSKRDSLCGRLQCENVESIPNLPDHSTLISTNISGTICWGIDYHLGTNTSDSGDVEDGTECGRHHICVKRRCTPISYFTKRCSPQICRMRGICNNRNHCHCKPPWRPPYCYVQGGGGSLDSGPPNASDFEESEEDISIDSEIGSENIPPHASFYILQLRVIVLILILLVIFVETGN